MKWPLALPSVESHMDLWLLKPKRLLLQELDLKMTSLLLETSQIAPF